MITRKKSFFTNPITLVSLGCVMAFAVACGDDDDTSGNETPGGGTKATAGSGGSSAGTKANGGSSGKGVVTPPGGTGTVEETGGGGAGPGPIVNEGGMNMGGAASCTDDADLGCYSCKPATLEQYLNHCPTTGCEPFDNSVLTSLKDGVLPDLPN